MLLSEKLLLLTLSSRGGIMNRRARKVDTVPQVDGSQSEQGCTAWLRLESPLSRN